MGRISRREERNDGDGGTVGGERGRIEREGQQEGREEG
jgi:hypothetical protein